MLASWYVPDALPLNTASAAVFDSSYCRLMLATSPVDSTSSELRSATSNAAVGTHGSVVVNVPASAVPASVCTVIGPVPGKAIRPVICVTFQLSMTNPLVPTELVKPTLLVPGCGPKLSPSIVISVPHRPLPGVSELTVGGGATGAGVDPHAAITKHSAVRFTRRTLTEMHVALHDCRHTTHEVFRQKTHRAARTMDFAAITGTLEVGPIRAQGDTMKRSSLVSFVMVGAGAFGCGGDDATSTPADGGSPPVMDAFVPDAFVQVDAAPRVGGGADLQCASMPMNAYGTYGGSAFLAINAEIFTQVTAELAHNGSANLGDSFSDVGSAGHDSLATFKGQLASYLVWTYGGPTSIVFTDGLTYNGADQNITAEHVGLEITSDQYDYFVSNIVVPALTTEHVGSADITACFAPPLLDASFKASIVGK